MPFLALSLSIFSVLSLSAENQILSFDFAKGSNGWTGDFVEYPVGEEEFYELSWGWENLPTELPSLQKGLFLAGNNHSDDLFMYIKRPIKGLQPNTEYALLFDVLLETNIPKKSIGIGGSPGESVYVKVGAATHEPQKIVKDDYYLLDVDKGSQSQEGSQSRMIGNLANPDVDPDHPQYLAKQLLSTVVLESKTDDQGQLWIFVGTDSGFEGYTKFYIARVLLQLHPISN